MKNLSYISIVAILLFLTACTSMNTTQTIQPKEQAISSSPKPSQKQNPIGACTLQKNSLKDRRERFIFDTLNNDEENPYDIIATKNISETSSKEINSILVMCDSAQKSWEKGDSDEALQYLDDAYASILKLETDNIQINKQKKSLRLMISKRIMEIYASRETSVKGDHGEIPVTINKYVQKEIDKLTGSEKCFFIQAMGRAAEYRPFIAKEFKNAGLPEELSWLPLIESGFKVKALSPARALGLWQFIPSTGYKFGLKRDYYIDERMDPIKSTKAAIEYLIALHKMFGDWSTVLAAYNCGEGRVLRTIRSQNVNYLDNFWDLYEKLPSETASYVPRFLATLHIIDNLEKYGMPPQKKIQPIAYQTITVNKQLRLTDIARKISVSRTILETLNPELKYGVLPPEDYQLRIPDNAVDTFFASIDDITPSNPISQNSYSSHRVRKGETLFSIAKKYGIRMGDLSAINNMSKRSAISAGKILKIPNAAISSPAVYLARNSSASKGLQTYEKGSRPERKGHDGEAIKGQENVTDKIIASSSKTQIKYNVKEGDTMWSIARKYDTTPNAIKVANSLDSYGINKNQEIIIPLSTTISSDLKSSKTYNTKDILVSNSKNYSESKSKRSTHWVKSGDTPFTIAQKYNMSLQRLFDLNRLSKGSRIFPGQKLLVE